MRLHAAWAALLLIGAAPSAPIPARTPIATLAIAPGKLVTRVETTRVDFLPGQRMPAHKHTVPVVCLVTRGSFVASIGNGSPRTVATGGATIEPAGEVVHYFRNASASDPAQLMCASLAGNGDTILNVMLPAEQ